MDIKLALDWTPNSNHAGFYVGVGMGWYKEKGINLLIQPPSKSYNSNETPGKRLMRGEVDFCIAPSETLISCWTSDTNEIKPVAIAAVLSNDTSAIAVKTSSNVSNVRQLDGKLYASYEGRFEMAIVKQMIRNSGGKGEVIEVNPPKLDCFDAVVRDEADATWIFQGWEGLIAKRNGISLNSFPMRDSGVPYGYSPILITTQSVLKNEKLVKDFLEVTSRGYEYAVANPEFAAEHLFNISNHESLNNLGLDFTKESMSYLSNGCHFLDKDTGKWGMMTLKRWEEFIEWLITNDLLTHRDGTTVLPLELPVQDMFTNAYL